MTPAFDYWRSIATDIASITTDIGSIATDIGPIAIDSDPIAIAMGGVSGSRRDRSCQWTDRSCDGAGRNCDWLDRDQSWSDRIRGGANRDCDPPGATRDPLNRNCHRRKVSDLWRKDIYRRREGRPLRPNRSHARLESSDGWRKANRQCFIPWWKLKPDGSAAPPQASQRSSTGKEDSCRRLWNDSGADGKVDRICRHIDPQRVSCGGASPIKRHTRRIGQRSCGW